MVISERTLDSPTIDTHKSFSHADTIFQRTAWSLGGGFVSVDLWHITCSGAGDVCNLLRG